MSTNELADVDAGLLHFRACIGRTARAPYPTHDLQVGNVITHVGYLMVIKTVFLLEFFVGLNLNGTAQIDVLHA